MALKGLIRHKKQFNQSLIWDSQDSSRDVFQYYFVFFRFVLFFVMFFWGRGRPGVSDLSMNL